MKLVDHRGRLAWTLSFVFYDAYVLHLLDSIISRFYNERWGLPTQPWQLLTTSQRLVLLLGFVDRWRSMYSMFATAMFPLFCPSMSAISLNLTFTREERYPLPSSSSSSSKGVAEFCLGEKKNQRGRVF
jgi:hypothetical protein